MADSACEPDVFVQMDSVRARLNSSNIAPWWSRAIAAVLDALTDGSVTYGYINEDATDCGPMMTERDAIVQALYTGNHEMQPTDAPAAANTRSVSPHWLAVALLVAALYGAVVGACVVAAVWLVTA